MTWRLLADLPGMGYLAAIRISIFIVKPRVKRESKKNLNGVNTRTHEQYDLRNAYLFSFLTSGVCYLGTLAILGARWLNPVLFSPLPQDTLSFRESFHPTFVLSLSLLT